MDLVKYYEVIIIYFPGSIVTVSFMISEAYRMKYEIIRICNQFLSHAPFHTMIEIQDYYVYNVYSSLAIFTLHNLTRLHMHYIFVTREIPQIMYDIILYVFDW